MPTRSFQLAKILGSTGTIKAVALDSDVGGGGVEAAANDSAALGVGDPGDLKFATNRKSLHMYNGNDWERIVSGADAKPIVITEAADQVVQSLSTDSSRTTFKVIDPEGFSISYGVSYLRDSDKVFFTNDSSNLPPPLSAPTVITKAADGTATYKFHTRMTESDGSGYTTKDLYKVRYSGSDGARGAVLTKNLQLEFFRGIFGMWADGTPIKAYPGASVTTNGTTSETDSTISRPGQRIENSGDYISFTGLPDFKLDPGSSDNYIVWAMKFPTTLDVNGYGMVIRDMNNHNVGFIDNMRWFGNSYYVAGAVNSRWYMSLQGGAGYNTQLAGNGGFPSYGADKYWVFVSKGGFGTTPYVKEVGGSGTMARLERGSTGEGRTGYAGSANNQITFFGGSPHNNSIANVAGGSNNEGAWKIDVAAVAVYPSSLGTVEEVAADFASFISA